MSGAQYTELERFLGRPVQESEGEVKDEDGVVHRAFELDVTHAEMKLFADALKRKKNVAFVLDEKESHVLVPGDWGSVVIPRSV